MDQLLYEGICTLILFLWVIFVVHPLTKTLYKWMRSKGLSHIKAVYYNRKVIHILAGGVVAFLVPFIYRGPIFIIILVTILAIMTYIPYRTGKLMDWFQVPDNKYDVHFIIMWGVVVLASWFIFHDWWYGVIPVAFMAFGDGVTGIVRNMIYDKRTKSWIGNLAMAAVTIPLGYIALGLTGAIAGAVASFIEHFEIYGKIDDNITVPLVSFLIVLTGQIFF